ncbi:cation:proton antiporter domain-containing protein [Methanofollis tationis]|uniref:Cation:proton antiporter n=1 Tax=Methanofollis tationis TaxID=81417 RepID=A0A7K4HM44_9EURY|nr:cation:proton antiporter [Methanofollis tationis]NVO66314.1 cation:proton antiporter [Methanofollis tationis]
MALFLLSANLGWIQGQIIFTEDSLHCLLVAFAGKILGGWLGSVRFMATHTEALVVGIGLCPRGEITLVVGQIGLLAGLITEELFSAFTVVALVSVLVTPALMAWGYRRLAVRGGRRSAGAR